jgi:hypothetical protein
MVPSGAEAPGLPQLFAARLKRLRKNGECKEIHPSAAKADVDFAVVAARLNSLLKKASSCYLRQKTRPSVAKATLIFLRLWHG